MPSFSLFNKMPATIRLFSSGLASFSTSDASVIMSDTVRPDALISFINGAIFMSKLVRIALITDSAVASGGKRYVSGKRYPSYALPSEIKSCADMRGSESPTFSAMSRTVIPSGNVMRTGGRPYSPVASRFAILNTLSGDLNMYAPDLTLLLAPDTRRNNRRTDVYLIIFASNNCSDISDIDAPRFITTISPDGKFDGGVNSNV